MCYQQSFPYSVIANRVAVGPNKMSYMVAYGLRPYFTDMTIKELMEEQSYFTLYFDEIVSAQVKRQMDVLIWFWSKTHNEVRVKYLTWYVWACKSRRCCERNAWCCWQVTCSSHSDAFSWNVLVQCEQIYNEQDKPGQERERLSTIGEVSNQLPNLHMPQWFSERYGSVWIQCSGIMPKPLLLLQEEFMQMKRSLWNWGITLVSKSW